MVYRRSWKQGQWQETGADAVGPWARRCCSAVLLDTFRNLVSSGVGVIERIGSDIFSGNRPRLETSVCEFCVRQCDVDVLSGQAPWLETPGGRQDHIQCRRLLRHVSGMHAAQVWCSAVIRKQYVTNVLLLNEVAAKMHVADEVRLPGSSTKLGSA